LNDEYYCNQLPFLGEAFTLCPWVLPFWGVKNWAWENVG